MNTRFYKGINLGGWLSQCNYEEKHIDSFIKESDIQTIASWGFDHVRIPVDYNVLEDENGNYKENGFKIIEKALLWCRKYKLNTIIDLHKTAGYSFDKYHNESGFFGNEQLHERFFSLWEQLAKRFGNFYKTTAFELLNEVDDEKDMIVWNKISKMCIERIRKYAPNTIILYGSHHKNSVLAVKDLEKPYDENIIYNFHCYEPLKFTHQGAYWVDEIEKDKRISYVESGCNTEYFEKLFQSAIETAKNNNTSLYCGEYGVIDIVSPEDTILWLRDINTVFEKYRIPRCLWNYKSLDFGISEKRFDKYRNELLKYI